MPDEISVLDFAAVALYALAIVAALGANVSGRYADRPRWHWLAWLAVAGVFFALAMWRYFDVEDTLRDALREALRESGSYRDRKAYQAPVAAGLLGGAGIVALFAVRRARDIIHSRLDALVGLAIFASGAMVFLALVRVVSFAPIDRLLYGPLKLNWLADIGVTLAIVATGAIYIRLARSAR